LESTCDKAKLSLRQLEAYINELEAQLAAAKRQIASLRVDLETQRSKSWTKRLMAAYSFRKGKDRYTELFSDRERPVGPP
jgi:multidrug resistance efflux pump